MAFDMGWAFAPTYGTPASYGVRVQTADSYPTTFTNGDGKSVNGGWVTAPTATVDLASGNDWRIVGVAYKVSGEFEFKVDLSSGSAPGAGTYAVDIALGSNNAGNARTDVRDNGSSLLDLTNGSTGWATAAGHFRDATATDVAATTTWTGTPVNKTWSTTTVNVVNNPSGTLADAVYISHFRLTLQAATKFPQRQILLGIGT